MMNKTLTLPGTFLLLCAIGVAEVQVGDGAVQLRATLTGSYDSNLRASAAPTNNQSDYYMSFQPMLQYRLPGGRFSTDASAAVRIKRYQDYTVANSEDADAHFDWKMVRGEEETTGAKLSLGYVENTTAVLEVNDLVRSKVFSAETSGEVLMARRNLISAGLSYRDSKHDIGSDQRMETGRLGYSYLGFTDGTALSVAYTRQENKTVESATGLTALDQTADTVSATLSRPLYGELTGGLTYGYRWLDRGELEAQLGLDSQEGSFYGLNLAGPFLPKHYFPKTTGTFRVGYEQADTPGLNDRSGKRFVGEMNVTWAARERTSVQVFARRAQDLSIDDNTVVNESAGISVNQAIGAFVNSEFALVYTNADFVNLERTDDRYEARAGATYRINRTWSSGVNYSFLHSKSSAAIANYDRHIVSGTVHYAF